jgi:dsRNA-specific ribonuclease
MCTGPWNEYRNQFVTNARLAELARRKGKIKCLNISPLEQKLLSIHMQGTLVEALVGVVYLERGIEGAEKWPVKIGLLDQEEPPIGPVSCLNLWTDW